MWNHHATTAAAAVAATEFHVAILRFVANPGRHQELVLVLAVLQNALFMPDDKTNNNSNVNYKTVPPLPTSYDNIISIPSKTSWTCQKKRIQQPDVGPRQPSLPDPTHQPRHHSDSKLPLRRLLSPSSSIANGHHHEKRRRSALPLTTSRVPSWRSNTAKNFSNGSIVFDQQHHVVADEDSVESVDGRSSRTN